MRLAPATLLRQPGTQTILGYQMKPRERKLVDQVEVLMGVMGVQWKPAILFVLVRHGPIRFGQLRRAIPGISQKMLTERLRQLERDGLVKRSHFPEIPPRVEYAVTNIGLELDPIFHSICEWGRSRMRDIKTANARFDARAVRVDPYS